MKERAKSLRRNMTDAENCMWYYLRNRRLGGYKFVREHVAIIIYLTPCHIRHPHPPSPSRATLWTDLCINSNRYRAVGWALAQH